MHSLQKTLVAVLIIAGLLLPFGAFAQIPIGGKVTGIFPCKLGGYIYQVTGFGIGSGMFWYLPGTITYLYGPPVIGKWVLGLAAPSAGCGLPTLFQGTSPAI